MRDINYKNRYREIRGIDYNDRTNIHIYNGFYNGGFYEDNTSERSELTDSIIEETGIKKNKKDKQERHDNKDKLNPLFVVFLFLIIISAFLITSAILTGSPFTAFSLLGSWLK